MAARTLRPLGPRARFILLALSVPARGRLAGKRTDGWASRPVAAVSGRCGTPSANLSSQAVRPAPILLSVPLKSRLMLARWRRMSSALMAPMPMT